MGKLYGDLELDWEKVQASTINLMVSQLLGQVWSKALEIATHYGLSESDVDRALEQAASTRHRYLENLSSSMMVKEGEPKQKIPTVEEILEELRSGYQRERDKRSA